MEKNDIFAEMKDFFNVSSGEDVAEKLGYSRNTARTWRQDGKISKNALRKFENLKSDDKTINLRFFNNVTASAGYGANNDDESFSVIPASPEFIKNVLELPAKKYDIIKIIGDSMEPFVQDGDYVTIDREAEIKNGDIVIANICGDTYIKKFLRNPIKKEIKLTSLNDFYQDIVLSGDEIENLIVVGKVKSKFSISIKMF